MSTRSDTDERMAVSGIDVAEPVLSREAVERFYQDPRVAERYGISVTQIRAWNGLSSGSTLIHPGDQLTVYR